MRKVWAVGAAFAATLLLTGQAAVTRDGILDSTEELRKIQIGTTTSAQLTEIAGKSMRVQRKQMRN